MSKFGTYDYSPSVCTTLIWILIAVILGATVGTIDYLNNKSTYEQEGKL